MPAKRSNKIWVIPANSTKFVKMSLGNLLGFAHFLESPRIFL